MMKHSLNGGHLYRKSKFLVTTHEMKTHQRPGWAAWQPSPAAGERPTSHTTAPAWPRHTPLSATQPTQTHHMPA